MNLDSERTSKFNQCTMHNLTIHLSNIPFPVGLIPYAMINIGIFLEKVITAQESRGFSVAKNIILKNEVVMYKISLVCKYKVNKGGITYWTLMLDCPETDFILLSATFAICDDFDEVENEFQLPFITLLLVGAEPKEKELCAAR